jgi:hypothetical protein
MELKVLYQFYNYELLKEYSVPKDLKYHHKIFSLKTQIINLALVTKVPYMLISNLLVHMN